MASLFILELILFNKYYHKLITNYFQKYTSFDLKKYFFMILCILTLTIRLKKLDNN